METPKMECLCQVVMLILAASWTKPPTCSARGLPTEGITKDEASEDNDLPLVEPDMVFTPAQWQDIQSYRQKRSAGIIPNSTQKRWPNNIVNYDDSLYSNVFSKEDRDEIIAAMNDWEGYTCIKFDHRPLETNRLTFVDASGGCFSEVGMQDGRKQQVGLFKKCRKKSHVLHELGHALGFEHEHNRPDRDDYVTINFSNVYAGGEYNFEKFGWDHIMKTGVPYDYRSIMHYGKTTYGTGGITIQTKDPKYQDVIGNATELSFGDIKSMNIMYNCNVNCARQNSECPGEGFVGKDCKCWCPGNGTTAQYCFMKDRQELGHIVRAGMDEPTCKNHQKACKEWGIRGDCQSLPQMMENLCPFTCDLCIQE